MVKQLREEYVRDGFAVTAYWSPNHHSNYADRYFSRTSWQDAEDFAHMLLMEGLYVNIIDFKTGNQIDIDPDEYQAYFDGSFDINNDIVNFKRSVQKESKTMKEFVNNNTEEQELQEFLQWLKDENIKVVKVADKLKAIYLRDEKDLDEASFYLQDRDYFKKLYDFGWHVAVQNKSLGRKLAKTLKMESSYDNYRTFDANDAKEAAKQTFEYMYDKYIKTNQQICEFQMDAELDTPDFWKTFAWLCAKNNFEYYVVSKDKNFDDVYYKVELTDVEEGYDIEDECVTKNI